MGFVNPSKYNNKARRFRTKRGRNNNQKRTSYVKKTAASQRGAKAQSRQITALAKAVDSLDTQLNPRSGKFTLAQGLLYRSGALRVGYTSGVTSPTQVFPLMPAQNASGPSSVYPGWDRWGPGVSAGTDDDASNTSAFGVSEISTCQKAKCGTMRLELAFSAGNEPSPIQVTAQVVTFASPEAAAHITQTYGIALQNFPTPDATGEMAIYGSTATFPGPSMGGSVFLNPAYFKVLKEQRFVLANTTHSSAAENVTDSKDTYKAISWNIPMGNIINARDRGNWTRAGAAEDYALANRRFLFITSDNINLDGQNPQVNIFASCIMYGQK